MEMCERDLDENCDCQAGGPYACAMRWDRSNVCRARQQRDLDRAQDAWWDEQEQKLAAREAQREAVRS